MICEKECIADTKGRRTGDSGMAVGRTDIGSNQLPIRISGTHMVNPLRSVRSSNLIRLRRKSFD